MYSHLTHIYFNQVHFSCPVRIVNLIPYKTVKNAVSCFFFIIKFKKRESKKQDIQSLYKTSRIYKMYISHLQIILRRSIQVDRFTLRWSRHFISQSILRKKLQSRFKNKYVHFSFVWKIYGGRKQMVTSVEY